MVGGGEKETTECGVRSSRSLCVRRELDDSGVRVSSSVKFSADGMGEVSRGKSEMRGSTEY